MMQLILQPTAAAQLTALAADPARAAIYAQVLKALAIMAVNLRAKSLQTHQFHGLAGPNGEKVWESYAGMNWRIFWYYGPAAGVITVLAITAHP
jgi:hypothetical protein